MQLTNKTGRISNDSGYTKEYTMEVIVPDSGFMAIFGEVEYVQEGHSFLLSTQTNISSIKQQ